MRDEFSAYARTRMGIGLPDGSIVYANRWDWYWLVSEAKGLVLTANSE